MKKIFPLFVFAFAAILLCSCQKVTMEQQIDNVFSFIQNDAEFQPFVEQAATVSEDELVDYYTYILTKKIKVKDIVTQDFTIEDTLTGPKDACNLIAEIPGKNKTNQSIIITAPLNDHSACAAAVEVMKAMKKAKVHKSNSIKLLLFEGTEGINTYHDISKSKNEAILFNLELKDMDKEFVELTVTERLDFFDKVSLILPQYIEKHHPFSVARDDEEDNYAINPHYGFNTNPKGNASFENIQMNAAMASSIICLMN